MKKILTRFGLAGLLFLLPSLFACSQKIKGGPHVTKSYNLPAFKAISASSGIDVIYTRSDGKQSIVADVPKNFLPYLSVKVKDGTLVVGLEHRDGVQFQGPWSIKVKVSAKAVSELTASSGAEISLPGGLNAKGKVCVKTSSGAEVKGSGITCDYLEAKASSGAEITLKNLSVNTLKADASSGAEVSLAGYCRKEADYSASSGAEVNATKVQAKNVTASASSGAKVTCHAISSLKARAGSGGKVRYKGTPSSLTTSKHGVSRID